MADHAEADSPAPMSDIVRMIEAMRADRDDQIARAVEDARSRSGFLPLRSI